MENVLANYPKVYNENRVKITYNAGAITGLAPDSVVAITPLGGGATESYGADGGVVISIDPNTCMEVTLTLQYGSPSLSTFKNAWNALYNATGGVYALEISDNNGKKKFTSSNAWVINIPETSFGLSAPEFSVILHCTGINESVII